MRWLKLLLPVFVAEFVALSGALSAPAFADSRVREVYYSPDQIITVPGHPGIQTMIEFAPDERIENIAIGDSSAWQVTPNRRANLIFVKPLMARGSTNMTVITDMRRYLFELRGTASGRPVYRLRFVYPEPVRLEPVAEPPPSPPPPPLPIHEGWKVSGDARIRPARVYDDGVSTYIAWKDPANLPAVLIIAADGGESPVNYVVKDDWLIVDGVAPTYILRVGKARAILVNLSTNGGTTR